MATQEVTLDVIGQARRPSHAVRVFAVVRRQPLGAVAVVLIIGLVCVALGADYIAPYDPNLSVGKPISPPGEDGFVLGTDHLGRDNLSRIIHGGRISLRVSMMAVLIGTCGGAVVGIASGYLGGKTDLFIQRLVDSVQAFPALILLIALVSILGASTNNAMFAIGGLLIAGQSRVIRSAVLSVKQNLYVESARAIGTSDFRIMWRHIFPNVLAPIVILASLALGDAILIEAGLSFLGLGTQPPTASWGQMLSTTGRQYMFVEPWLAIFPGIAIAITVLSFNLLGDSLRDLLDPRLRGR